jgi:hypothetical protein
MFLFAAIAKLTSAVSPDFTLIFFAHVSGAL